MKQYNTEYEYNIDLLSEQVNKKIIKSGKTLSHCCAEIGVSPYSISRFRNKRSTITLNTFIKIVKWLGTDANSYIL